MKFKNYFINKTPLNIAVEKNNVEIVELLLKYRGINVNVPNILN